MATRIRALLGVGLAGGVSLFFARADAGPAQMQMRVTVWGASSSGTYGGMTYGGFAPPTGALISERREVDIGPNGEVRFAGVAGTLDPASVHLRDLTEPSITIAEQRFVPGASTPTAMLARRLGDPVTVVTTKGDVSGVLRAVDDHVIVVETGSGDQRRLAMMRRDGYVLDVRMTGITADAPSLVWRLTTKKTGKHTVEVSYRADGLGWSADYQAVLDEPGNTIALSAWATVKNASGASYDKAELTLVSNAGVNPHGSTVSRPPPPPARFTIPTPVRIGAGDSLQVELVPRVVTKVRPVIVYEAMSDESSNHQDDAATDCSINNGVALGSGHAEIAVELDVPTQVALPDGRVRLFRRKPNSNLEIVSEEPLASTPGVARIKIAPDHDVIGERKAVTCNPDLTARTIQEKIEVRVENKGKQPVDVVIREFMWRYPVWRIEHEDKKGTRAAPQTQEYRVRVPAKGSQTVTYTVLYTYT